MGNFLGSGLILRLHSKLVYLSAVNADVQGMVEWIEFNQIVMFCASVQSAFPAVVEDVYRLRV